MDGSRGKPIARAWPMTDCVHHLERAIAIQRERDRSKWDALIDALPEAAQAPVRAYLDADGKASTTKPFDPYEMVRARARKRADKKQTANA